MPDHTKCFTLVDCNCTMLWCILRKSLRSHSAVRLYEVHRVLGTLVAFAKLFFESEASMRRKTKRQTKIQKNEVTKIRVFMKGVTKATPKMINKAQQAAMHYMSVRNAILEEVLKERTGLKTIPLTDGQKRRLA